MISTLYYSEMNQAVPGPILSPLMDPSFEYQVPSPSQWSDICRSPPLLHSPSHYSDYVDKIKEEPFSPQSNYLLTPPHSFYSVPLPLMSSEGHGEKSINLSELLAENSSLRAQVQQQQAKQKEEKASTSIPQPLDFFGLIDIKTEFEEPFEPFVSLEQPAPSVCSVPVTTVTSKTSPPLEQPSGNGGDVLFIALDHYRQNFQEVSKALNIPKDPSLWTAHNVCSWLEYEATKIQTPLPSLENWLISGQTLVQLTEGQFREMFPKGGNLFYANLEIWKAAFRTNPPTTIAPPVTTQQQIFHIQPSTSPHCFTSDSYSTQTSLLQTMTTSDTQKVPTSLSSVTYVSDFGSELSTNILFDLPTTTSITTSIQQEHTEIISSTYSCPSPTITTTVPAIFLASPKPSSSSEKIDVLQSNPEGSEPMEVKSSFSQDDPMSRMPTLLQTAESVPEAIPSTTHSRNRRNTSAGDGGGPTTTTGGRGATHIHLWQFLKELLGKPQEHGACIRWLDRSKGIFKIEDSVRVARLWGKRKNRPAMNYDKLSRSIRQYYRKGIMKKTERSQRLVYQFCHPYCL